jgi:RND family efflux transporter MFP subunit
MRLDGKVSPLTVKQSSSLSAKKGRTIWIVSMIALVLIAGGYFYYSKVFSKAATSNSSQTQTAVVRQGNLVVSGGGSGTLMSNSDATFGFNTSGWVTQVNVKVGDQVEKGQVLAQLDGNPLQRMKYQEAQQALKELYSAKSIAEVQKEIATAQDQEAAARDWLEYLISPGVVEAEENLAAAQQKLADAQAAANASPSATADQSITKAQQLVEYYNDKLTGAWDYYQTTYRVETFGQTENVGSRRHPNQVLVTTIDPVTQQKVPVVDTSADEIATARNNYAQAKETVSEGQMYLDALNSGVIRDGAVGDKIKTLYEAQLAVENAKLALDKTQLVAPISGIVTSLTLNVGQQIEADTSSVITISQLEQPYMIDAYVDQKYWSIAQVGNKANIVFDLLPEHTYTGTITLVYPELSSSFESSVVHLVVQLDKSISQNLPAGTGATVDVVGGEARGVLLVPVGAIHDKGGGKYTVTVLQNGKQVEREIQLGLKSDTFAEVKSGLEAGEIVVTK